MWQFPASTRFDRRIPKSKFYQHLGVNSKVEQQFVKEVDTIRWLFKLAPETLHIDPGEHVREIQIIEVALKQHAISKNLIELIDREIPYHLVFFLTCQGKGQLWISYKEESRSRENKFRVETYYQTPWQSKETMTLKINGLNLDQVYEDFLLQISGGRLKKEAEEDLKQAVEKTKEHDRLERKIEQLHNKIRNEKQFNRQLELLNEVRQLEMQLKDFE